MTGQVPFTFADGKDPEAFRTIGEVARILGVKQHVLRYWEEQFPMLKPLTRAGGRRYYRPTDVALIAEINRLLYHEGFTIRGARQALSGKVGTPTIAPVAADERPGEELGHSAAAVPGNVVAQLRDVRDGLAAALREG